jgi:hypothetical protein
MSQEKRGIKIRTKRVSYSTIALIYTQRRGKIRGSPLTKNTLAKATVTDHNDCNDEDDYAQQAWPPLKQKC